MPLSPTQTLAQMGGVAAAPTPTYGPVPGKLFLNPKLAPQVPEGVARPFAPGEYVRNPDGGWSSEITVTVQHPNLNGGKPTVVPSLWLENGKPVRVDEDSAIEYAIKSGLPFQSFNSLDEAEAFSVQRESEWQKVNNDDPSAASIIAPLWAAIQGAKP